jgi:GNAT superfamily N-acetyltransferase
MQIVQGYTPGCIGQVLSLHAHYYAQHAGFGLEFEAKVARELTDFMLRYQAPQDLALFAVHEGKVQASIVIDGSQDASKVAHLRWFIVSDALRGQGVGAHLLNAAMQFVDERAFLNTYLWTFAGLDAARALYLRHGFELVLEEAGQQWGKVVLEQRYERARPGSN